MFKQNAPSQAWLINTYNLRCSEDWERSEFKACLGLSEFKDSWGNNKTLSQNLKKKKLKKY